MHGSFDFRFLPRDAHAYKEFRLIRLNELCDESQPAIDYLDNALGGYLQKENVRLGYVPTVQQRWCGPRRVSLGDALGLRAVRASGLSWVGRMGESYRLAFVATSPT